LGQPSKVGRGQIVNIDFHLDNDRGVTANLQVLAFPRDRKGRTRGTLRATVSVRPLGPTPARLSFLVPQDAVSGDFGLQLSVWHQRNFVPGNSSTYLINEVYPRVFRVRGVAQLRGCYIGELPAGKSDRVEVSSTRSIRREFCPTQICRSGPPSGRSFDPPWHFGRQAQSKMC